MGAWGTPLMYAFREREKILDLFESLSGSRMMCDYMRFGGCRVDADDDWLGARRQIVDRFPKFLDEFEELILQNEIVIARTQNVGKAFARAGDQRRHHRPDAARVRRELRHSQSRWLRILSAIQISDPVRRSRRHLRSLDDARAGDARERRDFETGASRKFRPGPIVNPKVKVRAFRPPVGEAYGRIEAPKGELGFYLISDGGPNPYRYRVRPPSFINLTVLEDMCLGHTVADVMVILGSVDIVMGEVDR